MYFGYMSSFFWFKLYIRWLLNFVFPGITFPSGASQKKLLEETYAEAGVDPREIVYVEAHGTGTPVGDPQECSAISDVLCKDRQTPLLIGSVKSNMGHCECASGKCTTMSL